MTTPWATNLPDFPAAVSLVAMSQVRAPFPLHPGPDGLGLGRGPSRKSDLVQPPLQPLAYPWRRSDPP